MNKTSHSPYALQDMDFIKKLGEGALSLNSGSFGVVYLVRIASQRKDKLLALKAMEIEPLLKHKHVDHAL